jgi:ligand-binding SRPBCC domain-containing protein
LPTEDLTVGTRIAMSVAPAGAFRQSWVSEIVARENDGNNAYFQDVMEGGPFRTWEHTHLFYRDGPDTILRDRLVYETPVGPADPLAKVGFEGMFRQRHRRTQEILEGQR